MREAAFNTRGDFQCAMRLPMLEETFNARRDFQCSERLSMRDATSNARGDFQCAMRLPMRDAALRPGWPPTLPKETSHSWDGVHLQRFGDKDYIEDHKRRLRLPSWSRFAQ